MRHYVIPVLFLALGCGEPRRAPLNPGGGEGAEGEGEGEGGTEGEGEGQDGAVGEMKVPAAGAVVGGDVAVEVALWGDIAKVEILSGGEVVAEADVGEDADGTVTLALDTTEMEDGAHDLEVRVTDVDDNHILSLESVSVVVDNTAPVVAITSERLQVVFGPVTLDVEIDEAHVADVKLLDQESEEVLAQADTAVGSLSWDSTQQEDDLYRLALEVTDEAGNVGRVDGFPIVVAYNGQDCPVQWIPPTEVPEGESKKWTHVPSNWMTGVEFHTRVMANNIPGVRKVITWLTWDGDEDWLLEFAMGQGFCPHRGISYLKEESRSGEIILEIARDELPDDIVMQFPAAAQDDDTFPHNGDPASFGSFFGHIAPMDPADHVNERIPIDSHIVFLFK